MQNGDKSASQAHRQKLLLGRHAVVFAAVFLLAGAYFGSTHGFRVFLLSIPILSLTFFGALIPTILATQKKNERRLAWIAWVLIAFAAPAYLISYDLTQRVRFFLWAPAHFHALDQASRKNGVIMDWDGWGMAGMDTESYLVVDTEDRLRSKARADQWTKQIGQTCGLWKSAGCGPGSTWSPPIRTAHMRVSRSFTGAGKGRVSLVGRGRAPDIRGSGVSRPEADAASGGKGARTTVAKQLRFCVFHSSC